MTVGENPPDVERVDAMPVSALNFLAASRCRRIGRHCSPRPSANSRHGAADVPARSPTRHYCNTSPAICPSLYVTPPLLAVSSGSRAEEAIDGLRRIPLSPDPVIERQP